MDSRRRTILAVDNDAVFLSLVAKGLRKMGYGVLTAEDGAGALEILKTTKVDAVLLDLVMPNTSGERLCRMIRQMDSPVRDVHIVIVTATAVDGAVVESSDLGADDYIAKGPFPQTFSQITEALSTLEYKTSGRKKPRMADPTGTPVRSVVSELLSVREHLETVIVSTTEGLVELTEEGKIVFANRTAVSILGMPEVDLISTKWTDHFEEGERSSVTGLFSIKKQKQQNGNPPSFRLRNGREITIKVLPVEGKKNHIVSLEDVTERRRAERAFSKAYADLEDRIKKRNEELANANTTLKKELAERLRMEGMLQQSRNTLRSVFDSISDPLILVDSHLNILMANRSTLDHFNFADYFEVLGKPFLSLVEGCYDDNSLKSIRSAIVDFQKLSLESSSSRQPGSHKKTVIYPIQEDHRKLGSAIIRITDITKEKNLEKEILQREKLATLGLLVSSIVHELNNPNNFIIFNIPILKDYIQAVLPLLEQQAVRNPQSEIMGMSYIDLHEDLLKLIDNIEHGAQRIHATISKLTGFARKRGGSDIKLMDPGEPIERAVAICRNEIKKTVKDFQIRVEEDLPAIMADVEAIEQVLINLLINASHASDKKNSWIKLRAFRETENGRYLNIEVSDNGCGMDENTRNNAFLPFFTTKKDGTGTGIGLYIVNNLVQEMGGKITVQSEPGTGSTFRVSIPIQKV
ncbi:MAG TPA: ATP-binding protein [Syntrophales bacterium]|jgi:PAS domain S-box-containing protein|nr:ATP-binding protein [Syntrophales bacterium]